MQAGALVTLKLMTGSGTTALPALGSEACFSVHKHWRGGRWLAELPRSAPWTHTPAGGPAALGAIEDENNRE